MMNIISFYKNWRLVELDGLYYVVNKTGKEIVFKGTEEKATECFCGLIQMVMCIDKIFDM